MRQVSIPSFTIVSTLATVLLVSGCALNRPAIDVSRLGPPYQIAVFQDGEAKIKRQVPAMSQDEEVLARWVEANRSGWRVSHAKFQPQRVVSGDGFTLNFTDDACILHLSPEKSPDKNKAPAEAIQLYKRLTPGDIELSEVLDQGTRR